MSTIEQNYRAAHAALYAEDAEDQKPQVVRIREALAPLGLEACLSGLENDADERDIMGRLVEIGPDIPENGEVEQGKQPTAQEMKGYIAASRHVSPAAAAMLKARVQRLAYNPTSPHRGMALRALAEGGDAAAMEIVKAEEAARLAEMQAQEGRRVRTCFCPGDDH